VNAIAARARGTTFRARLGIATALAVALVVTLVAFASYLAVKHVLLGQIDNSLRDEIGARQIEQGFAVDSDQMQALLIANNSILQVITSGNTVLTTTADSPLPVYPQQEALVQNDHGYDIRTITYGGAPYRVITAGGFHDFNLLIPVAIQIARPLGDIQHTLADLRIILWLVGMIGIAAGVGLGFLVGRTMLRPVERLTAAAEHVASTQDLDATIDVEGHDELASLARSFNAMLVALAASRQQQAQLISDAGHELRTPLTSLRTNIELLMKAPDLPDPDRSELVADIQAQLEEITTLIGDVVELAREEETQAEPIEVRLDSIVAHAVERARRRATTVTFDTQLTPGSVRAQPALLERAVLNVLDNAAKWSPPGGVVSVRLARGATWTLDILDQGPGISAQDLPHVFDRFYRAASARSMPGSGLGLAIVRQVVSQHGGSVSASCPPPGGTLVHIVLPTVAESEPEATAYAPPTTAPTPAAGSGPRPGVAEAEPAPELRLPPAPSPGPASPPSTTANPTTANPTTANPTTASPTTVAKTAVPAGGDRSRLL
jgi:two-component system sensor histidine kinase MprB